MTPSLTARFVAKSLDLSLPFHQTLSDIPFRSVSTDSRSVQPGDLFVALKGDTFDGHAFVDDVVKKGATGILCESARAPAAPGSAVVFPVDDTLVAFRKLAAAWRRNFDIPVVAVAGSVGKTTTKELIAALLSGRFEKCLKTEGSFNGFVGIPMTLMKLSDETAAVVEIGIDEPGAMAQHLEIVRPGVSVVTAIEAEHLEKLHDLETVAREEALALKWVAERGGQVALNTDDEWIAPLAKESLPHAILYGLGPEPKKTLPTQKLLRGRYDAASGRLEVNGLGLLGVEFAVPLPGAHNARNLLAAIAIASAVGLSETEIREGLHGFKPPYGRSQLVTLPNGPCILCDYYNASPSSMRAGLETLATLSAAATGKSWACLADMLELGPDELRFHAELAEPVLESHAANVLLFGRRMKALHDALARAGFSGRLVHYEKIEDLIAALAAGIRAGDVALIKGSRSMKMERVFHALEAKFKG